MRTVRLTRLIAKKEVESLIKRIAAIDDVPLSILDETGHPLLGDKQKGNFLEYPIILDGSVLGLVISGDEKASAVASLLNYLVELDREANALAQETIEKIEEIKDYYEMAGQASNLLKYNEISKIIADEAKASLDAEDAAFHLFDEKGHAPIIHEPVDADDSPRAEIVAPMKVDGRHIGDITVRRALEKPFSEEEQRLLETLAFRVAAPVASARVYEGVNTVLQTIEELNELNDVDTILDTILFEARKLANADAGSIFLVHDGMLSFAYVHNDTLFSADEANKAVYQNFKVPISEDSIVGYAALTGRTININDAYKLPDNLPYSFNSSFDKQTGYHTASMLTIPLKTYQGKLVGVMQIINAHDENSRVIPFPRESRTYVPLFANNAAVALERATMTREQNLRMVRLAAMRNPNETVSHAQRVGAYSAEIYQRWASKQGLDPQEIKAYRDLIRLAAMLHDVGKVGLDDIVLQKDSQHTMDGHEVIRWHPILGARLFHNSGSNLDKMSYEICLNHHEKWDGTGYPGYLDDIMADDIKIGQRPKHGEDIPLAARIVALANEYDHKCFPGQDEEKLDDTAIQAAIREESGKYYDPSLVEAFFEIYEVIEAIKERYPEESS